MNQLKRSKSLTELAAERLRKAIIDNEYILGEPLSESLLAESMGISKTPVREALALLKIEGLVNIVPQKGTFVFTLTSEEVNDLIELRYLLESSALKLAHSRNKDAFINALSDTLVNMQNALKVNNVEEYLSHDSKFHECFFNYCNNRYLHDAYLNISAKSSALRTRISHQPSHPQKTYKEHENIYKKIVAGEIDEALNELRLHFSSFEKFYVDHIDKIAVSDFSSPRKNRQNSKN